MEEGENYLKGIKNRHSVSFLHLNTSLHFIYFSQHIQNFPVAFQMELFRATTSSNESHKIHQGAVSMVKNDPSGSPISIYSYSYIYKLLLC